MNALIEAFRRDDDARVALVVYILNLLSLAFGVTALIAVVFAYVYRDGAGSVLASHYTWQIRTFWIGLLFSVVGWLTAPLVLGWLVLIFLLVWWIVRAVKGLQWLDRGRPVPRPTSWWFG